MRVMSFFILTLMSFVSFASIDIRAPYDHCIKCTSSTIKKKYTIGKTEWKRDTSVTYAKNGSHSYAFEALNKNNVNIDLFGKKNLTLIDTMVQLNANEYNPVDSGVMLRVKSLFGTLVNYKVGLGREFNTKDRYGREKYSYYRHKRVTVGVIMVGPIPVKTDLGMGLRAGIKGSAKFSVFPIEAKLKLGPFAEIDGSIRSNAHIIIAKGGVVGELNLFGIERLGVIHLARAVRNARKLIASVYSEENVKYLGGALYGEAKVRAIKWKKKKIGWIKIKYPVGWYWKTVVREKIFSWKGFATKYLTRVRQWEF